MQITEDDWIRYKDKMAALSDRAAENLEMWLQVNGGYQNVSREQLTLYMYGLATYYGEATASLAAEMYDEVAALSGVAVPSAEVAETASYGEIAKAVNAVTKNITTNSNLGNVVVRYVKRAAEDTTLKNVKRDQKKGAQYAWVPAGDTCAFCMMLASNGWQNQSERAMKNGHASHIHPNCDCTYAVRFDGKSNVKGYNPEKYKAMYENAEGRTWNDKLNSMRRIQYQENKDRINAQKRENYAEKKMVVKEQAIKEKIKSAYDTKRMRFKTEDMTTKEYVESKDPIRSFKPISSEQAVPTARKEATGWINKLSESAKHLIQRYTYNPNDSSPKFYERINSFIRNGYKGEKDYTEQVNIISNALKASKLQHNYVCYRGSNHNPFEGMKVGERTSVNQFFSTTLAKSRAFEGEYNIMIFAPEGTNAAYIEELSYDDFKSQREMLFDKDVIYEVLYQQGKDIIVRALV